MSRGRNMGKARNRKAQTPNKRVTIEVTGDVSPYVVMNGYRYRLVKSTLVNGTAICAATYEKEI